MNNIRFKPEVLAPAGDLSRAYLAAEAGADAVYFGLSSLSARSAATNISLNDVNQMVSDLHKINTRAYVTLNTILYQDELSLAKDYLAACDEAKVDGIIIQDLAWLKILADYEQAKGSKLKMELHGSTQMNIHSDLDIIAASRLGFDRIVVPREISQSQLRIWSDLCAKENLDIEIFVHGAICMAVSGRCQMSFAGGGRSANRGACAQTCRLPYQLINDQGKVLDHGSLLSAKDQSLLSQIPSFFDLKIKSLKIEGRMKDGAYVVQTSSAFRKLVDFWADSQDEQAFYDLVIEEEAKLLQVFNRGGSFTQRSFVLGQAKDYVAKDFVGNFGLYVGEITKLNAPKGELVLKADKVVLQAKDQVAVRRDHEQIAVAPIGQIFKRKNDLVIKGFHPEKLNIMQVGDKLYLLKNHSLEENLKRQDNKRFPLTIELTVDSQQLNIMANADMPSYELSSQLSFNLADFNLTNSALNEQRWTDQLAKLGNSIFKLEKMTYRYNGIAKLPAIRVSQINQIRRDLLDQLYQDITKHIEIKEKENLKFSSQKYFSLPKHRLDHKDIQRKNLYSLIFAQDLAKLQTKSLDHVDQIEIPMLFLSDLKSNQIIFAYLLNTYPDLEILIRLPDIMQAKSLELYELLRDSYLYETRINFSANGLSAVTPDLYYAKLKHINEGANIINREALDFYLTHSDCQITLSPEWNDASLDETISFLSDQAAARLFIPKDYFVSEMFLNYCPVGKNMPGCRQCVINQEANWSKSYRLKGLKGVDRVHNLITYPIHCTSQIYSSWTDASLYNELSTKNKKRINQRHSI